METTLLILLIHQQTSIFIFLLFFIVCLCNTSHSIVDQLYVELPLLLSTRTTNAQTPKSNPIYYELHYILPIHV